MLLCVPRPLLSLETSAFSLHLDDLRDNDTKKFEDLLETFNLSQNVSGPTHLPGQTWDLIITRSSDDIVLASPKTTFPISDHLLFSVLLVSHDQLCHAKNWLFVNSKILILLRSQLILPLLCFVQTYTGTTLMHSPTALTRFLLTYWISLPA